MRLFLAVEFTDDIIREWDVAIEPLRALAPEFSWVCPEKRHLTLKFLGDVSAGALDRTIALADTVARASRPFGISLREIGAFPNFRRARVVWIGVEQEARLELMHHDMEVAGELAGFEIEGRPFRPHVTIARIRETPDVARMRVLAKTARTIELATPAIVHGITLFESTLARTGSAYRRLHVAPLGG